MARRKKSRYAIGGVPIQEWLVHPATLFVGLNVVLGMIAIWAWGKYQHQIVAPARTNLAGDRIVFAAPPGWIPDGEKEIFGAVLAGREPEEVSVFEPGLIRNTVASLRSIGWIEEILKVEKSREGIKIDLAYRSPLALVELDHVDPAWNGPRLIPVDRTSAVLPQTARSTGAVMPLISMFRPVGDPSQLLTWNQWPDERVQAAARIGNVLASDWRGLGLYRIVSWRYPDAPESSLKPFHLWTKNGENSARVIWGNAPGEEVGGEASWEQKVTALRAYVQKNGPLDQLDDRIIDLRSGSAMRTERAAENPSADRRFQLK